MSSRQQQQEEQPAAAAVVPFRMGSPMIVAGPTNSGKTFWVHQLLLKADRMFERTPKSILYCYSVYQPLYNTIKDSSTIPFTFHEGMPTRQQFDNMGHSDDDDDDEFHIIVLDDLMEKIVKNKDMMELFSIYCHHKNVTAILITQNLFVQGAHSRNISLNAHVFVLFANKRDEQQIHRLGRQFYPTEWRGFVKAYKDATDQDYGYLVVDVTPVHPRILQLRTNIFPPEYPTVYAIC